MPIGYRACMVGVLLLWPAVSPATITAVLENPGQSGSASGLTVISGWAFSDTGAPITVRLRINGEPASPVACCRCASTLDCMHFTVE